MKNLITYSFIALSFSMMILGCLTEKKAVKQIAKISHKQPEVLANECGKRFPPVDSIWEKETFIEGETMVFSDTVTVHDTVTNTVYKYITKTANKTDTLYKDRFQQVENTAMIEANSRTIKRLENDNIRMTHSGKVKTIVIACLALIILIPLAIKLLKKWFTFNIF